MPGVPRHVGQCLTRAIAAGIGDDRPQQVQQLLTIDLDLIVVLHHLIHKIKPSTGCPDYNRLQAEDEVAVSRIT